MSNLGGSHSNFVSRAVIVAVAAFALAGCERGEDITVESQDLGPFSAIDFNGAGKLVITVGAPPVVQIDGGSRTLKELRIYVRNDTLVVRPSEAHWSWLNSPRQTTLNISTTELKELNAKGAGSIRIEGFKGGEHRVIVAGAFNVEADGELDRLDIALNGAGNVDYGDVVAQEAKAVVRGAGHIEVNAVKLLDAAVHGVGAVEYAGSPAKVESAVHGLGDISPVDKRW